MAAPRFQHNDYTVGWLCSQDEELVAASAMLDEEHPDLPQPSFDTNQYTLGSIGHHNVVIVCLPSGVARMISVAVASTRMGFTFPSLQYMLLVGVTGGIPGEECDIRLGDVVVGTNGVIHYDWGRIAAGGRFIRSTEASKVLPHVMLRNGVARLRSTLDKANRNISDHLSQTVQENKALPERFRERVRQDADLLFESGYTHVGGRSCAHCDIGHLVQRVPRSEDGPYVHYGLVASGSSFIRDSGTRDIITRELNALCIDTEAAGLMSTYPAIVIRGICDYTDSHKSPAFQNVAAARASAYAKELLKIVPAHRQNGMIHTIS